MQIGLVPSQDVDAIWQQISPGMAKACKRCESELTAGALWQMCRSGNGFLIIVYDADRIWSAGVWRFEAARPGQCFRCVMMYGENMRAWLGMARDFISTLARDNGAVALVAKGRSGWARVFGAEKQGLDYEVMI